MIYNLSNFNGKKIMMGMYNEYHERLVKLFSVLNNQPLDKLDGMKLLTGMLEIIR